MNVVMPVRREALYRESVFQTGHYHDKYFPNPSTAPSKKDIAPRSACLCRKVQCLRLIRSPDVLSCTKPLTLHCPGRLARQPDAVPHAYLPEKSSKARKSA
jgi:hypothetical protein